jgi:large subunit ribosomal protein L25
MRFAEVTDAREIFVTQIDIAAEARSDFGKGAARKLRRSGRTPAVLYGDGQALTHVSLPAHDLDLALRKSRVVLAVSLDGTTVLVKPRDIQRDPVKRTLEHVDLIVISQREAALRSQMADAIAATEAAATEAGVDPASAVALLEQAVADGETPLEAASHAVQDAKEQALAYAAASAATGAAEDAEASSAEESGAAEAAPAPAESE